MKSTSIAQLSEVVADVVGPEADALTDDVLLRDMESWDSLKHMSLVLAIEEAYGIRLSQDDIVRMTSLGSIRSVLHERGIE